MQERHLVLLRAETEKPSYHLLTPKCLSLCLCTKYSVLTDLLHRDNIQYLLDRLEDYVYSAM